MKNITVLGSSGAIGSTFVRYYARAFPDATVHAVSQSEIALESSTKANAVVHIPIQYDSEKSIEHAAKAVSAKSKIDLLLIATGILHGDDLEPEKSLKDLSHSNFQKLFEANTIVPAMLMKYFLPHLQRSGRSVCATLSARVGSISDNRLGGWYAYRASKAALNMIIKNAAIETKRKNKNAIIVGLHPGTVDSALSKPFQKNVPEGKLFSPEYSVEKLASVIQSLKQEDLGKCFAWDGQEITP